NSFPFSSSKLISNFDSILRASASLGHDPDDYDSERDILILEELLSNDSLSLPENESFHFDIPSSSRPLAKPPDGNSGILNVKMMGDISEHKDYNVVITPDFPITDSLIMENENLDTILETESDEFIKSSVENLVSIPSESEDFSDIESKCDMLDCDDSQTINFSTFSNPLFDDSTSGDDESSHEEEFSGELAHTDLIPPRINESFYDDHVKEISSDSTTTHSDSSLYDSFIFDLSINPFPPADRSDFYEFADELTHIISPPRYDCVCFKIEPNSGDFTMDVVKDTFPTREPRVYNALPTHPTLQLNLEFILSSESLFTFVVWIFLSFLLYSVAPQYLLSF
nr:hypothetical protein [Tanacetum cinerariifolium]